MPNNHFKLVDIRAHERCVFKTIDTLISKIEESMRGSRSSISVDKRQSILSASECVMKSVQRPLAVYSMIDLFLCLAFALQSTSLVVHTSKPMTRSMQLLLQRLTSNNKNQIEYTYTYVKRTRRKGQNHWSVLN